MKNSMTHLTHRSSFIGGLFPLVVAASPPLTSYCCLTMMSLDVDKDAALFLLPLWCEAARQIPILIGVTKLCWRDEDDASADNAIKVRVKKNSVCIILNIMKPSLLCIAGNMKVRLIDALRVHTYTEVKESD